MAIPEKHQPAIPTENEKVIARATADPLASEWGDYASHFIEENNLEHESRIKDKIKSTFRKYFK